MGRGKAWSKEESETLAKAWKQASEGVNVSRDPNWKTSGNMLHQRFVACAPANSEEQEGRWKNRSPTAARIQFDAIAEDINKFNKVLDKVVEQTKGKAENLSNEIVLRAAIGVHIGLINGAIDFDAVHAVEGDWKHYGAWCILKSCARFSPQTWPLAQCSIPALVQAKTSNAASMTGGALTNPSSVDRTTPPNGMRNGGSSARLEGPSVRIPSPASSGVNLTNHEHVATATPPERLHYGGSRFQRRVVQRNSTQIRPGLRTEGVNGISEQRKRPAQFETTGHEPNTKMYRTEALDTALAAPAALEVLGQAISALGDALSEYNALTLFSRPQMQGRQDQTTFFDTLAEKHVMKAKIDRDKLKEELQKSNGKAPGARPQ